MLQPLAKSALIPLGLTASAADAEIHKKDTWLRNYNTNNIKQRNGRHYENSKVS